MDVKIFLLIFVFVAMSGLLGFMLHDHIVSFFRSLKNKREDKVDKTVGAPVLSNRYEGMNTETLLYTLLDEIGCHPVYDDEVEHRINFMFQGEYLFCDYNNESPFVAFYDVWWYSADMYDIDNVAAVRKAVNDCNLSNRSTLVYSMNEDNKKMGVHNRTVVPVLSQMPHLDEYLKAVLSDFFQQHNLFYQQVQK